MRTIIRLRRFGNKNTPQYKLIVQGHYTRIKSKYVEHLGYWFPVKVNEHDRSVVLNKGRLRYWVSVGAVYSPKVQKLLSFLDIANAPWISFGSQTTYKCPHKRFTRLNKGVRDLISTAGDKTFNERYLAKIRAKDEENLLLRRVKFEKAMNQYVGEKEEIVDDNSLLEDDIKTRTEKFLRLKKIYDDIEAKDPLLSPLKREMLYRKMNELAALGVMTEEEVIKVQATPNDAILSLYEQRKKKSIEILNGVSNLLQPISKEEFLAVAKLHIHIEEMDSLFDDFFAEHSESGKQLTRADLHIFCKTYSIDHDSDQLTSTEIKKIERESVVPTRYPLTPFPDPSDYDPKDWFDLDDENNFNITHNYKGEDKWFNLPLTNRRRLDNIQRRQKQSQDLMTVNSPITNE